MAAGNFGYLEDCTILRTTDKAVKLEYDGEEYWFPRACLENDGEHLRVGESGYTVAVARRILREKGIDLDD